MDILHLTLRVVHVLFGVFWAGASFLIVLFLEPSIRATGPAGGQVMTKMVEKGYSKFIGNIALVTILTGLWLLWQLSGHFSPGFMGSKSGMLLSTGMLTGILSLGTGVHMVSRSVRKMVALGKEIGAAGGAPTPDQQAEMARLQGKVRIAGRITAVLLLATIVLMTLGVHI